ncbi:MAG TPA: phosphatase PAP2 family protein [Phycisphaerae bacterium]|nr:phosphatase PAP2 family protein [Phycisphaerae bacterium]HRW53541.1 phosphatase PAP2 family protein [Phycisphaerae bacterium]
MSRRAGLLTNNPHDLLDDSASSSRWTLWAVLCVLLAAAIAMTFPFDGWLLNLVQRLAPDASPARRVLKLSRWAFYWPVIAAALLFALRRAGRGRLVVSISLTFLIGMGLLYTLKNVVGRARPDEHIGAYAFHPLGFTDGFDSFPSGHTTTYFILALLIGASFPKSRHLFLVAAALAALSRIAQQRHFGSDVLGGVLLAILSVRLATTLTDRVGVMNLPVPRPPRLFRRRPLLDDPAHA